MLNRDSLIQLADRVNAIDLQNYVRAMGWRRLENIPGDIAIYQRPESELDEILVPQERSFVDYSRRMAEAITFLAEFEHRSVTAVLNDLLLPPSDIIRFTMDSSATKNGTIPLNVGLDFFAGAKKALLASACSVIQPQTFHPRMSRSEAEQFVQNCKFGTETGSFVLSLICPLRISDEQLNLWSDEPFARKVTKLLVNSLQKIVKKIKEDNTEHLLDVSKTPEDVISANLFEALSLMQPLDERSYLNVIPTWSRTEPIKESMPTNIRIPKEYFPIIEKIGQKLRPKETPKGDLFIGKIDALNGKPGVDGRPQGEVIFAFLAEDEILKAKIDLSPEDYAKACDAHKYTQFVELHGVLHRGTRIHRISDHKQFSVRDEKEET